jgi:exopolysaccharide production protein ExoZ
MRSFSNLQALRAGAALSVVLFHMTYAFFDIPAIAALNWARYVGWAGVDVFFVISGFIIYTVAARLDWSGGPIDVALRFLMRRLERIYPVYWFYFALCLILTIYGVPRIIGTHWTLADWPFNAVLLSLENKQVPVAWTLAYELFFYLCFALALTFGRARYRTVLALWFTVEALVTAANHFAAIPDRQSALWANPLVMEFAMGCGIAVLIERGHVGLWRWAAALWVPFFVLGGLCSAYPIATTVDYRVVTFGIGAAFLVYALCAAEVDGRFKAPRWAVKLGDASYSLYLCQEITLFTTRYVLVELGLLQALWGIPALVLALAVTIATALASYRLIERPVIGSLQRLTSFKRRFSTRREPVPPSTAGRP